MTLSELSKEINKDYGKTVRMYGECRWTGKLVGVAEDEIDYYYVIHFPDGTVEWFSAAGGYELHND